MAYKRQIAYLDLIENGIKRGNAGFVKWEKYEECHILSVFVNGVEDVCSKEPNVELGNGHSIGKIRISYGRGEGTYLLARDEKDWVEEINAIRIVIGPEKELVAEYESVEALEKETQAQEEMLLEPEKELEKKEDFQREEEIEQIEATWEEEAGSSGAKELEQESEELSFWEEMAKKHELYYPFENDTACYRIFPKEINLLHANYHMLQNNQFLMHGYYNYRHLIIFPKKDKDGEYWLGVPGIYHEREKMAARMYGFEKFEGTKKGYRVGDLGYYLITVEA